MSYDRINASKDSMENESNKDEISLSLDQTATMKDLDPSSMSQMRLRRSPRIEENFKFEGPTAINRSRHSLSPSSNKSSGAFKPLNRTKSESSNKISLKVSAKNLNQNRIEKDLSESDSRIATPVTGQPLMKDEKSIFVLSRESLENLVEKSGLDQQKKRKRFRLTKNQKFYIVITIVALAWIVFVVYMLMYFWVIPLTVQKVFNDYVPTGAWFPIKVYHIDETQIRTRVTIDKKDTPLYPGMTLDESSFAVYTENVHIVTMTIPEVDVDKNRNIYYDKDIILDIVNTTKLTEVLTSWVRYSKEGKMKQTTWHIAGSVGFKLVNGIFWHNIEGELQNDLAKNLEY